MGDSDSDKEQQHTQKPKFDFDPDGSNQVARGLTHKEAKAQHADLTKQAASRSHVDLFLHGATADLAKERRKNLAQDDLKPNLDKLTDRQKLSLKKRKSGGNKVVRQRLQRHETKRLKAAIDASDAVDILQTDTPGLIEAENDMERTTALTQAELKREHLDPETARHIFDLDLDQSAPYGLEYDRSGRYSIMYGQKGHLALMNCHQQSLVTEFCVNERIRNACFLHNFTMFATAQKNHVFIYDNNGAEIHRLNDHTDPMALQFLPYHWLLASIGRAGFLKYQDTSTGELVSTHRTKLGACKVLRQNPSNSVLHAGHSNGTVTLWSPANSQFLAKILCHKGAAIHSLAIDPSGRRMVTGGADRQVKVWDLRMYKATHAYYTAAGVPSSLDISQRGILGIGHAGHATLWSDDALVRKVSHPYMHHALPRCGPVETLRFRPFEDVCGIGHARGISSIVIPGSGEPSVDTHEYNTDPNQDAKQRREAEVRALLDKLQPDMIGLDPEQIGGIELSDPHMRLERLQDIQEEANRHPKEVKKQKTKKRGRSKIQTKLRRKHKNIVDQNTLKLKEAREEEKAAKQGKGEQPPQPKEKAPTALKRFF